MIKLFCEDSGTKRIPKWQRVSFYDETKGEVYMPAFGLDILGALADGVRIVEDGGHCYLPVEWLKKEHPDLVAQYDQAQKRIKEAAKQEVSG